MMQAPKPKTVGKVALVGGTLGTLGYFTYGVLSDWVRVLVWAALQ